MDTSPILAPSAPSFSTLDFQRLSPPFPPQMNTISLSTHIDDPSTTLLNSASDMSFSPLTTAPPPSAHESGFIFPPPDVLDPRMDTREDSPDTPSDPHLMVVGDMLKNIAHTAHSASAACSLGQGLEANARIDELKKTIALVSELIAATQIADPPVISRRSSLQRLSAVSALSISGPTAGVSSPVRHPAVSSVDTGQAVMQFSSTHLDLTLLDPPSLDSSDLSRKRCGSSMAGDRVIKALKIEPQDDPLHIMSQPVSAPPPFPPTTIASMATFVPTNATDPASRPTSSAGLPQSAFNVLSHRPKTPSMSGMGFPIPATSSPATSADFISTGTVVHPSRFPPIRSSWSDGSAPIPQRTHQHSLSGSSLTTGITFQSIPTTSTGLSSLPFSSTGTFPSASSQSRSITVGGAGISPPIGRVSRSGSLTSNNPFAFGLPEVPSTYRRARFSPTLLVSNHRKTACCTESHFITGRGMGTRFGQRGSFTVTESRVIFGEQLENFYSHATGPQFRTAAREYRAEVDRIFFEFLNKVCSNLDATDVKGEPIHQTLMAKKMQRLDESPDFRPFKFRIQAFTNAFLEELARQGYPEDKIPMKKIRTYLWNQPYISRFNEEGKKTKSKGNHIWNIDAKKLPDCGWTFRPFHRRVAGSPPSVAYVGLRWSWAPRIWDPQASRTNLQVTYSSPSLPSWLSWEDDVLQGTPPPDAESCDITVVARYMQDGGEEQLAQCFHLSIAPMSTLDGPFPAPRRSSVNGDVHKARRISCELSAPQSTPARLRSATTSSINPPVANHDAQVMQVLTTAAQRVAQEAQSQVIASTASNEHVPELQALAKQQHVLTVTAQAFDQEVSGQRSDIPLQTNVLAAAAQQVVLQAARQVAADRSAVVAIQISAGLPPPPPAATQVTVNEVSVATQSAVAQAVEITGPLSSEVDVLITASSLLQQQTRAPVSPPVLDPTQHIVPVDVVRSRSTSIVSAAPFASGLTTAVAPYPPPIPLPEFN
ncbi:hypothetical protein JVU11DRAFT_948 [Chiua virens]|nr:hypothetical protein JVU11DRAFT_948 [Chiua virens]